MRDPQMSRQLYALDFSDYDGTKTYTPEASFAVRFPKALKRLKGTMELPGIDKLIQKWWQQEDPSTSYNIKLQRQLKV